MDDRLDPGAVRLDIWLWAARFFRTRSLAKDAIEGGKVQVDGNKAKVSKAVRVGMTLSVRQGQELREVIVLGLSDKRGGAPQAQTLYRETAESLARREAERLQRQLGHDQAPIAKPGKKARRMLERFKRDVGWRD